MELTEIVPTTAHIDSYIKILVEDYPFRSLQMLSHSINQSPQEINKHLQSVDKLLIDIETQRNDFSIQRL